MIQNLLHSNLSESHTIRTSRDAMQEQLLASLHRLHEAQNRTQVALRDLDPAVDPRSRPHAQSINGCLDEQNKAMKPAAPLRHVQTRSSPIAGMIV